MGVKRGCGEAEGNMDKGRLLWRRGESDRRETVVKESEMRLKRGCCGGEKNVIGEAVVEEREMWLKRGCD